jgi:hypothetical protein
MPDKTVKRRLQDAGDAALASDDGPIFSTVARKMLCDSGAICCAGRSTTRKCDDDESPPRRRALLGRLVPRSAT